MAETASRGLVARASVAAGTLAVIAVFVLAGNWQRDRMHLKQAERAALDAAAAHAPVPLPATDDWAAWRYRRVVVEGAWRDGTQLMIDNKVQDGRAGFHVVAPVVLDDGRAVLVDRGWIPAGAGASRVPQVPAASGRARTTGRIVLPPKRYLEWTRDDGKGNVRQNLDPARIGPAIGMALLPIVIEQDEGAADDGLVRRWPAPDLGVDMHRGYMLQWYAFAALAAGLWLFLTWRVMRAKAA